MTLKQILLLASTALALGCNKTVDVTDGTVPAEFQTEAAKYMGVYNGNVEGRAGRIEIALVDNKAVLTFTASDNSKDILDTECESKIGQLQNVTVNGDKRQLRGLSFAFDAGACTRVQGDFLDVSVKEKDGKITLSTAIYSYSTTRYIPGRCTGRRETRECTPGETIEDRHYISGEFTKLIE